MQDRYLFRAKRLDNGEWVQGCYIYDIDRDSSESLNEFAHRIQPLYAHAYAEPVNQSTICQCTGLKDKNGRVIWENDIVNGIIKRGAAFYRCLVLWNECKARFDVRAMGCNFPMTLDECTDDISMSGFDYEVVGNVFDNPELLEDSHDGE